MLKLFKKNLNKILFGASLLIIAGYFYSLSSAQTPFVCGDTLADSRMGQGPTYYATVQIGTQCWMKQNINIGTRIDAQNKVYAQGSSCSTIYRYCYQNNEANCNNNMPISPGGLYDPAQAMCGAASCNGTGPGQPACSTPVQGICLDGWHIPSHYEYVKLERALCTSGTCDTDFPYDETSIGLQGTNEGSKLRMGGSSGFESTMPGVYDWSHFAVPENPHPAAFEGMGSKIFLMTSTLSSSYPWIRVLDISLNNIYTTPYSSSPSGSGYTYSVRCVKDNTAPSVPTITSVTAGDHQATVNFNAPASDGGSQITSYTVTSSPGNFTSTGSASPLVITGLTNLTPYTFVVTATNVVGTSASSSDSSPVIPVAPAGDIRRIFVTSTTYNGNLGGLSGADAKCQARADAASLGGTWKAWLSSGATDLIDAKDRTTQGVKYTNMNGEVVANTWAGLISGTLNNPIKYNENSAIVSGQAWTGSNYNGTHYFSQDCSASGAGWTSTAGTGGDAGYSGVVGSLTGTWSSNGTNSCSTALPLYCIEQTPTATVPSTPTIGSAVSGNAQATVYFSNSSSNGGSPIIRYTATSADGKTGTSTVSPIVVTGLTNGTAYSFTVKSTNAIGDSASSNYSNTIMPSATNINNLSGYAWSESVGWIDFDMGRTLGGISISTSGYITGYAWNENIGWIKFGGLTGFPSGPGTVAQNAQIVGSQVVGWARACGGLYDSMLNQTSSNNTCSGTSRTDGWDGWISLSGTGYGVSTLNQDFSGYAWGSDVAGWIDFSSSPFTSQRVKFTSINPIAIQYVNSDHASVLKNDSVMISWSSTGADGCYLTQNGNSWIGTASSTGNNSGSMSSGNLTASTTFRANCHNIGNSATSSVFVEVVVLQANLLLTADENQIAWNAENVLSCSLSQQGVGVISNLTSGSIPANTVPKGILFTLDCLNLDSNHVIRTVTSVNPAVSAVCSPSQNFVNRTTRWTASLGTTTTGTIDSTWSGAEVSGTASRPGVNYFDKIYTTVGPKAITGTITGHRLSDNTAFTAVCSTTTLIKLDTGGGGEI